MEDLIQILVFFAIIGFAVARKAKEVKANRPGQSVPQTKTNHEPSQLPEEDEDTEYVEEVLQAERSFQMNEKQPQPAYADFSKNQEPDSEVPQEKPVPPMQPAFRPNLHPTASTEKRTPQFLAESAKETPNSTGKKKKGLHIHITTRSEARKALIYSEIFNRKYE